MFLADFDKVSDFVIVSFSYQVWLGSGVGEVGFCGLLLFLLHSVVEDFIYVASMAFHTATAW